MSTQDSSSASLPIPPSPINATYFWSADFIAKIGFPIFICLVLMGISYRVLIYMVDTVATPLVTAHIEYLHNSTDQQKQMVAYQRTLSENQETMIEILKQHDDRVKATIKKPNFSHSSTTNPFPGNDAE